MIFDCLQKMVAHCSAAGSEIAASGAHALRAQKFCLWNPRPKAKSFAGSFASLLAFVGLLLITGTLLIGGVVAAGPSAGLVAQKHKPSPKKATPSAEAVVPFHVGEQLSYRILWSKFSVNAAAAKFTVMEHRDFFGHPSWHFRLQAQTVNTTRKLYALDDQFDSYTDAVRLTALQFEMYLNEQGKQQTNVWRLIPPGELAPPDVISAKVPAGARDAIDILYILRAQDWKKTPELRVPVFDGEHLYDIVAHFGMADGHVTVPAGNFTASRIDLRVYEHGQELADTHFAVWLAQDAARTPVLVEAEAPQPFGSARIELIGVQ
jgi:hypothetical protein